jgi:hypothetical protein
MKKTGLHSTRNPDDIRTIAHWMGVNDTSTAHPRFYPSVPSETPELQPLKAGYRHFKYLSHGSDLRRRSVWWLALFLQQTRHVEPMRRKEGYGRRIANRAGSGFPERRPAGCRTITGVQMPPSNAVDSITATLWQWLSSVFSTGPGLAVVSAEQPSVPQTVLRRAK